MKICKDCKHYRAGNFNPNAYCFSEKSIIEQDLVTGNYKRYTPKEMRSIKERCGVDAISFEAIPVKETKLSFAERLFNVKSKS